MMRTRVTSLILAIFFLFSMFVTTPVHAHQDSLASSKIKFENKKMHVSLFIDQMSILEINGFDISQTKTIDESLLTQEMKDKSFDYIQNGFHVKNNGNDMSIELESISLPDNVNVQFDMIFSSDELIDKVDIDYNLFFEHSGGKHKNVATIENGDITDEFVFTNGAKHLGMEAGVALSFWDTFAQFTLMGVEHIITGYDHLVFLFALILLGGTFGSILKIVTSFTVGHSITLILASLEIVALPDRLVESVIAISILYVGIENLFIKNANYRWLLTGAFGLIHGFGFAGALAETQIPKNHFIEAMLTFNVGVEIGQMFVVALLLPIILQLRRFSWNLGFVRTLSSGVALFGLIWFAQRAFELDILPFLAV